MQDTMTARAGRRIGRVAALGAVALVLAGALVTPAEARTRSQAARTVRNDRAQCNEIGGTHSVNNTGNNFHMICLSDDGGVVWDWDLTYDE